MGKDVLVILMVAFGLFAILMFILFFIYLKKYYNSKHLESDYKKELDESFEQEKEDIVEVNNSVNEIDEEFIPMKKK